jgi:hypothetical protein
MGDGGIGSFLTSDPPDPITQICAFTANEIPPSLRKYYDCLLFNPFQCDTHRQLTL